MDNFKHTCNHVTMLVLTRTCPSTAILHSIARSIALITLLALLSGCSIVRLSYDHGPQLAWWWLNGYVGFNRDQAPHAKQAIQQWFDWHRATQLPHYVNWLTTVRNQIDSPLTPTQICNWSDELQNIIASAFDQAVQLSTPVLLRLGETQWRHLEQRYSKSNDELYRDYLQPDLEDRRQASIKRTVKRIENLYGSIDNAQRQLITARIALSPFNPEIWMIERQRRQQETLRILRQLTAESTAPEQTTVLLKNLLEHTHRSDDPDYRAYQLKLSEYTCDLVAYVHNRTTPKQRQHAYDKLQSWEADLRTLMGEDHMHTALE